MLLSELQTGEKAYIVKVRGSGAFRKRILEMGFVRGQEVTAILNAPLKDPIKYGIMEYEVSLRRSEAKLIEISKEKCDLTFDNSHSTESHNMFRTERRRLRCCKRDNCSRVITVALVGNPNAGKTSIFNFASGAHEHVGNYSGVTVESKIGVMRHKGYTIKLVDLPGTYSLSAYSPEELYVRKYITEENPDIIINVVSASALERNLYLTTELIDMEVPVVVALNMYDELKESGRKFDYKTLGNMLGIPFVPTVGRTGDGITQLLDKIIELHEAPFERRKDEVKIPYGRVMEKSIAVIQNELQIKNIAIPEMSYRYISIKMLEKDKDMEERLRQFPEAAELDAICDKERQYIEKMLQEDPESAFTNARYGFIAGGLKETLTEKTKFSENTRFLDAILTNKYVGFPLFFVFLWIMFEATFRLGAYPMEWIENGVGWLGNMLRVQMQEGVLKDLIVDGIIGGVGGVIVFLPNIVILYLFISFMEDSGYMARAAFIMDKVMHRIGLHGKSFIPLIMGFGCNVPAIMATRTIESRNSRLITMLIVPFMSCSARLPVYLLFAGAFFPRQASFVLMGLYLFGILLAAITALFLRKYLVKGEDTPFVMELPPYRMPTLKSVFIHMWDRSWQYLRKIGGIILLASIIIWFLGYFPRNAEHEQMFDNRVIEINNLTVDNNEKEELLDEVERLRNTTHQENSYIGKLGKFVEPVMRPLGFDWKISVSLLSGMAAKEIVISTLGVLFTGDVEDQQSLQTRLKQEVYADGSPVFTPIVNIGFLLFVLIYFPCIATIAAIKEESHSWRWALFSVFYSTGLAWLIAFLVYQIGSLLIV